MKARGSSDVCRGRCALLIVDHTSKADIPGDTKPIAYRVTMSENAKQALSFLCSMKDLGYIKVDDSFLSPATGAVGDHISPIALAPVSSMCAKACMLAPFLLEPSLAS